MNAAREDDVDVFFRLLRLELEKHFESGFPKHETRERPDVSAALASFEDEASSALAKKHIEKLRGRRVKVRFDAGRFERTGLLRSAAGENRKARLHAQHGFQLLGAQIGGDERENPDAPGSIAEQGGGFLHDALAFGFFQERESKERQSTAARYRVGETSLVADTSHGALEYRIA